MDNDIYVLDTNLNRIDLIEQINTFIWTIRYSDFGDFVLTIPISSFPFQTIVLGNYIENPKSNRLMIIESIGKTRDDSSGESLMEVTGRSLEAFLEQRWVTPNTTEDYWTLTGNVGWIATELVRRICVDATELTANDKIDNLIVLEQDASTVSRTIKLPPTNLYTAVKDLADLDNFGFRIFFNRTTKKFEFRIYRGIDRSATQSVHPKIIFSKEFDNLVNTTQLKTNLQYKNIAIVNSGSRTRIVQLGTGLFRNMNRRVMYVDASDIKDPTNEKLDDRGRLMLRQQKLYNLVEGEVEITPTYVYQIDYEIGDVVTIEDTSGATGKARITEFVTSFDKVDGVRRYPTFEPL